MLRSRRPRTPPAPPPARDRRWPRTGPRPRHSHHRVRAARDVPDRIRLAGRRPAAAWTATTGTAAPAPAAAPSTQRGGWEARNSAEGPRIMASPGTMKQPPPTRAPVGPASRQAQKMANWVEAGPGKEVGGGDPVLELGGGEPVAVRHAELAEHGDVGRGAAEARTPIRPHWRAMVATPTNGGSGRRWESSARSPVNEALRHRRRPGPPPPGDRRPRDRGGGKGGRLTGPVPPVSRWPAGTPTPGRQSGGRRPRGRADPPPPAGPGSSPRGSAR